MQFLLIALLALSININFKIAHAQDTINAVVGEAARAGFSELERQLIKKYLGEQKQTEASTTTSKNKKDKSTKAMPPGLAKRDSLPPGLAAQLERNGTLPPGLAKRELPADLEQQLPPVKDGYERTILEDLSVVLIEKASGRIADIINDAVTENNM